MGSGFLAGLGVYYWAYVRLNVFIIKDIYMLSPSKLSIPVLHSFLVDGRGLEPSSSRLSLLSLNEEGRNDRV